MFRILKYSWHLLGVKGILTAFSTFYPFLFWHFQTTVYMNGKTKNLGEGKTKKIRERVLELLKEHPTYSVYCTGHSLGKLVEQRAWTYTVLVECTRHLMIKSSFLEHYRRRAW